VNGDLALNINIEAYGFYLGDLDVVEPIKHFLVILDDFIDFLIVSELRMLFLIVPYLFKLIFLEQLFILL